MILSDAQMEAVLEDLPIRAIKTGMLPSVQSPSWAVSSRRFRPTRAVWTAARPRSRTASRLRSKSPVRLAEFAAGAVGAGVGRVRPGTQVVAATADSVSLSAG